MGSRIVWPRRAGLRWREGAPDYILDCFDDKGIGDHYTVLFARPLAYEHNGFAYVPYLGMNDAPTHPQGISMWGEMQAHEAAMYRYRSGHHRVRWLDLPEHIRKHVIMRAK